MPLLGYVSYGAAALVYGVTAAILVASHPGGRRATLLSATIAGTSLWAAALLVLLTREVVPLVAVAAVDAARLLLWTACVLSWLPAESAKNRLFGISGALAALALLGAWSSEALALAWTSYLALVLMALLGMLAVEQVFRNAQPDARHIKLLCLAAGGVFVVDLFVYSQAALLRDLDPLLWQLRGIANAALLPLIVLGTKGQSEWERELFISRQVVFYTASFLGVGAYLLAMGLVAYLIRAFGSQWTFRVDLAFLAAAIAVLFMILFSSTIRARFKVFLVKHFFKNKYDYREEWLRLTQALSRAGDLQQSAFSGLEGMARIIGSQQGYLWLDRDEQRYDWLVSLDGGRPEVMNYGRKHPLIQFLASTAWVVDTDEYIEQPDRYGAAFGDPGERLLPAGMIIVPLDRQGHLQGIVALAKPAGLRSLNFEDHDILKTAGRQVAAVLAQALAQEKLAETRQFEAMNRFSAFLMHDLKNIIAQQDLVVANAQRFRHRPEFIDDAFATIRSGADRMKRVLEQLASSNGPRPVAGRVDVSKVLMEVRSQCAERRPIPELDLRAQPAWVRMDHHELANVLLHLVRNAQDATPADGAIKITLANGSADLRITIADTGCGMDNAFIRDRLFRPFDSTKGTKGMGIGAYQARHIVRLAGGDIDVESAPGAGTTFTVRLPLAR